MTRYHLADMSKWTEKAKRNGQLVHNKSVQYLVQDIQGDVGSGPGQTPIKTGNLRNSIGISVGSMPSTRGGSFMGSTALAGIMGLPIGPPTYIGFQAVYARRLNNGFTGTDSLGRYYNQSGRFFVEAKAARWSGYVARAAAEIGA